MSKPLKTWFTNRYPNNTDVVKFFIENDDTFTYDKHTGNVDLISSRLFGQPLPSAQRLVQLEVKARGDLRLVEVSDCVSEAELFLLVLKLVNECHDKNNTYLKIDTVVSRLTSNSQYKRLCEKLPKLEPKPITNPRIVGYLFEYDLLHYLNQNYPKIFRFDTNSWTIGFEPIVAERKKIFEAQVDDPVFGLYKTLVAKYIESHGSHLTDKYRAVDVDDLYREINVRHPIATDRIFNRKTDNDYNLLMFCDSFPDTFKVQMEKKANRMSRMICLLMAIPEETKAGQEDDILEEIYYSEEEDNEDTNVRDESQNVEVNPIVSAFDQLVTIDSEDSESESESLDRQQKLKDIKEAINYWRRKQTLHRKLVVTSEEEILKLTAELKSLENFSGDRRVGN